MRWPVNLGLIVMTVSLLFRHAPRRQQPGLSWLMVGAGLATALWWLISLLLAAFVTQSRCGLHLAALAARRLDSSSGSDRCRPP
jgi:uncharacterized BrkB/YihY/UPF0761 family membrane protein